MIAVQSFQRILVRNGIRVSISNSNLLTRFRNKVSAIQNRRSPCLMLTASKTTYNISKEDKEELVLELPLSDRKELETIASVTTRVKHLTLAMKNEFNLTDEEIDRTLGSYPLLWQNYLLKSFSYLRSLGLTKRNFMLYPWLTAITPEDLDLKRLSVRLVYPEWFDINICAPLLQNSAQKITTLLKFWESEASDQKYRSKIHFLADVLEVNVEDVLGRLITRKFLEKLAYKTVVQNTLLLLDAGVSKEDVLRDVWVLRYSSKTLQKRLEVVAQAKIPIKPWVVRCSNHTLQRTIDFHWESKQALGDAPDFDTYLCRRLQCSTDALAALYLRSPKLRQASPAKIKASLDMLFSFGVAREQILASPRILSHKIQKIEKRLREVQSHGLPIETLGMFYQPEDAYQNALTRLLERRKSK